MMTEETKQQRCALTRAIAEQYDRWQAGEITYETYVNFAIQRVDSLLRRWTNQFRYRWNHYPTACSTDIEDLEQVARLTFLKHLPQYNPHMHNVAYWFKHKIGYELNCWVGSVLSPVKLHGHYVEYNRRLSGALRNGLDMDQAHKSAYRHSKMRDGLLAKPFALQIRRVLSGSGILMLDEDESNAAAAIGSTDGVEAMAIRRVDWQRAMKQLGTKRCQVIALRVLEGLTCKQVGDLTKTHHMYASGVIKAATRLVTTGDKLRPTKRIRYAKR